MKLVTVNLSSPIKVPFVPNFLITELGAVVPIGAFSDDELTRVGRAWTANLLEQARHRRRDVAGPPAAGGARPQASTEGGPHGTQGD